MIFFFFPTQEVVPALTVTCSKVEPDPTQEVLPVPRLSLTPPRKSFDCYLFQGWAWPHPGSRSTVTCSEVEPDPTQEVVPLLPVTCSEVEPDPTQEVVQLLPVPRLSLTPPRKSFDCYLFRGWAGPHPGTCYLFRGWAWPHPGSRSTVTCYLFRGWAWPHPGSRSTVTCSEVEPDPAQEVVAGDAVVVPHGQLQTAVGQLLHADVVEQEDVVPLRVTVPLHHWRLLFHTLVLLRQQVAEMGIKM